MNRKEFLTITASLGLASLLAPSALAQEADPSPARALTLLKEGNARYVSSLKTNGTGRGAERRAELTKTQRPHAIILSCSDSRVAPEVFFDSGIGELFVVRVAGNIVSGSNYGVIGTCEYGAAVLQSPLLVVLGHENCGAVKAAMDTIDRKTTLPGSIEDIVEAIRPAVEASKGRPGDAFHNATEENVRHGMKRLPSMSTVLDERLRSGKLMMVGGIYDLASGKVNFF